MSPTSHVQIIIAENSPIIHSGIALCLRRLPGLQVTVYDARDYADLVDKVRNAGIDIVVANPNFTATFSPSELKEATASDIKIIGIETSILPAHIKSIYDATLSIVDDIPAMTTLITSLMQDSVQESDDSKVMLSSREKEVVALVVKGLTNKEIADKLFLSVHTVMTHRRNIARKLEIHSATGLTIYAIVNHIVDISDVNL